MAPTCWFTPQIPKITKWGWIWEPGAQSRSPQRVAGLNPWRPDLAPPPLRICISRMPEPGNQPDIPMWYTDIKTVDSC